MEEEIKMNVYEYAWKALVTAIRNEMTEEGKTITLEELLAAMATLEIKLGIVKAEE